MDADKATPQIITSESAVRESYRDHRYLQDLAEDELLKVCRDTFRNFMTINLEGKASPLSLDHPRHWYWRVRLLHTLEEFSIRFGPYPNGFDDSFVTSIKLPRPDSFRVEKAASAIDSQLLARGEYLVKYGQKSHLFGMLDKGLVRIAPASSYAEFEKNDAISDTELKFTCQFYNSPLELISQHAAVPPTLAAGKFIHGTALLELTMREDYYLFCLSASYDPRLFDDFESDACMIIDSPIEFRDRLMRCVADKTQCKGWNFSAVTYVDPFSIPDPSLHPFLRKHHRYAYQDEVRAVWQMQKGCGHNLDPIFVELGSLRDIARVILIDTP
jgi:hypothetical protein